MSVDRDVLLANFGNLFERVEADGLAALAERMRRRRLEPGEELIGEGAPSSSAHWVLDGALDVSVDVSGAPLHLARVESGGLVGEVSCLSPGPATATVRAAEASDVLSIDHAQLEELWTEAPAAASALVKRISGVLAHRIRALKGGYGKEAGAAAPADEAGWKDRLVAAFAAMFDGSEDSR
jgi:CRP-like cAMP-binding protein